MQAYRWAGEQAGLDMSGFEVDLAWLGELEHALATAHDSQSDQQRATPRLAVEAARALRRAIKAYEAAPGARPVDHA